MLLKPINTSEGLIPIQSQNGTRATFQDGQKGRPSEAAAKKQPQAYPLGYVEDCFKARTKLEAFFNILLEGGQADGYYR
jgi:hypothetical protein